MIDNPENITNYLKNLKNTLLPITTKHNMATSALWWIRPHFLFQTKTRVVWRQIKKK